MTEHRSEPRPLNPPVAATVTSDVDLNLARDKRVSDHNDALADRRPQLHEAVSQCDDQGVRAARVEWTVGRPDRLSGPLSEGLGKATDYDLRDGALQVRRRPRWLSGYATCQARLVSRRRPAEL